MRPDRTARRIQKAITEYLEIPRRPKRPRQFRSRKSVKLHPDVQMALARLGPTAADLASFSVFGGVIPCSPEDLALQNERRALVMAVIEELPTEISAAAKLLLFEGQPIDEIAMSLGVALRPDEAYELKKVIVNTVTDGVMAKTGNRIH